MLITHSQQNNITSHESKFQDNKYANKADKQISYFNFRQCFTSETQAH